VTIQLQGQPEMSLKEFGVSGSDCTPRLQRRFEAPWCDIDNSDLTVSEQCFVQAAGALQFGVERV
jgi:hypothetical protein